MAISTYKVYLMHKVDGIYEKLIDIKDFPDLGGAPEMLETTTLSNSMQTYIPGIQSLDALEFTANYDKTDFEALKALEDAEGDYAVWFGGLTAGSDVIPDGSDGKFYFKGKLSVFVVGGGVNEVVDMTITIAPSTSIAVDEDNVITITTDASDSADIDGKAASELQTDIAVGASAITGTLNYVTGYTGYSDVVAKQSGNYLALEITTDVAGSVITAELTDSGEGALTVGNDNTVVFRVTSEDQIVRIVARAGDDVALKEYSLADIVLTPAP